MGVSVLVVVAAAVGLGVALGGYYCLVGRRAGGALGGECCVGGGGGGVYSLRNGV